MLLLLDDLLMLGTMVSGSLQITEWIDQFNQQRLTVARNLKGSTGLEPEPHRHH